MANGVVSAWRGTVSWADDNCARADQGERVAKGASEAVEHRRVQRDGRGPSRGQIRNYVWLLAAAGSVAFAVAAAVARPSGTPAPARVASQPAAFGQAGGGPGGPMTGPGGWSGPGGLAAPGGTGGNAVNATAATSQNWAGYAAAGAPGTFTSVSSAWTQPAVTCTAQQTFSSFWVGLDGDSTQTVEQTGTEADCSNGTPSYQGWFEMFPNAPVFYTSKVAPGDAMSASVVANGGGAFTLTLSDQTQGWTQATSQTAAAAQLGSAEIIAEAPSDASTVLPLSNFGAVSFSDAAIDTAPLGNANAAGLTMVSAGGVTEATPSALTNGNAFSVSWDSNGTAASPAAPAAPAAGTSPVPTATSPAGGGFPGGRRHHHGGY